MITFLDAIKLNLCINIDININKFSYFNLDENIFKDIDILNIEKKMRVSTSFINADFKGSNSKQLIKEFLKCRNRYAHGKNSFNVSRNLIN
ncbi:hypothetical protein [Clostridium ihumii]|uniref:hypothetical protein n=1 Tax=Clostridium ihumii TaxID=1470356 RepID=UPI003D3437B3